MGRTTVKLLEWWPDCLSPGDSQTMDWYQRSACSLLGFHFASGSGVKLFSLVAIDEETFNLDDLVEAKIKIEIPVGKGIPTSRIVKVGDLQRPVYFRPIPVSAGTRVGQPILKKAISPGVGEKEGS